MAIYLACNPEMLSRRRRQNCNVGIGGRILQFCTVLWLVSRWSPRTVLLLHQAFLGTLWTNQLFSLFLKLFFLSLIYTFNTTHNITCFESIIIHHIKVLVILGSLSKPHDTSIDIKCWNKNMAAESYPTFNLERPDLLYVGLPLNLEFQLHLDAR